MSASPGGLLHDYHRQGWARTETSAQLQTHLLQPLQQMIGQLGRVGLGGRMEPAALGYATAMNRRSDLLMGPAIAAICAMIAVLVNTALPVFAQPSATGLRTSGSSIPGELEYDSESVDADDADPAPFRQPISVRAGVCASGSDPARVRKPRDPAGLAEHQLRAPPA
jgi:hypothetical protein